MKLGVKMAEKPEKVAEEPAFTLPKRTKKPEMPEEMKRDLAKLANIEQYDGTSNGQMEIK